MSKPSTEKWVPSHERKDGPWDDYELEEGGRHLEHAEHIRNNPKYAEAIAKHHEGKAKKYAEMADKTRDLQRSGKVSESALKKSVKNLEKASKSNHA